MKEFKITKNKALYISRFYAFCGGKWFLIPTVCMQFMKGYYQITFTFLTWSYDFTLINRKNFLKK